jgi:hypothetical protein
LKESSSHEVGREQKQLFLECFKKTAKDVGRRHLFLEISTAGVTLEGKRYMI